MSGAVKPRYFATPALFREWLEENHESATRQRRLEQLIADSAAGLRIGPLRR